jgi:hypothetical protein
MSALTEFYAETNWLNRFGIKGPFYGPRGHLGLDLKAKGRQKIPALRSGTVQPHLVRSYYVGYTLSIRHALGDYDGYVHLYGPSRAAPGTVVAAGDFIGEAATWGDFTGISWAGAHLHLTHGSTPRCVFGEGVDDPAPYVRAAIATLTPASTPSKTPIQPPTVQEDDMAYIAPILEEKNGQIVETGQGYSGPGGFYFIQNEDHRKLLERDIEATRKSARGEKVDAKFLEGERIIVDGYKSGTRKR